MELQPEKIKITIPLDKPSPARMYDYFLGGYHNFEIDRLAAEKMIALYPDTPLVIQTNRAFLRRAVHFLCEQGIEQFIDIGSGIPTVGNVHEVVQQTTPNARVVYVDIDPVAVRYSEAILKDVPNTVAIEADAYQPEQIITHPLAQKLLDFNKPIGVLLVALLHFVTDDDIAMQTVQVLRDAIPSGSYIAIAHATNENIPPEIYEQGKQIYAKTTQPMIMRSSKEIAAFFTGLELVEPGVVHLPLWHPEEPDDLFLNEPERSANFGGIGRKP